MSHKIHMLLFSFLMTLANTSSLRSSQTKALQSSSSSSSSAFSSNSLSSFNSSSFTSGSTSSARAAAMGATNSSSALSFEKYEQQDKAELTERAYNLDWSKSLDEEQEKIAKAIYNTVTTLPVEVIQIIAKYSNRKFAGDPVYVIRNTGERQVATLTVLPDDSLALGFWEDQIDICTPVTDKKSQITTWYYLQTLCGNAGNSQDQATIIGLSANSFTSGGPRNQSIIIWSKTSNHDNQESWRCSQILKDHTARISKLAMLPNRSFASASLDNTVKIWSSIIKPNGQTIWLCAHTLRHEEPIHNIIILTDTMLAAIAEESIYLWSSTTNSHNKATWQALDSLTDHAGEVRSLILLPNGTLVSGASDKTIKIWSPSTDSTGNTTWQCTQTLLGHTNSINSLILLPGGSFISASSDSIKTWSQTIDSSLFSSIKTWATSFFTNKNGQKKIWQSSQTIQMTSGSNSFQLRALVLLPDGTIAFAFGAMIIIWRLSTNSEGETTWNRAHTLQGYTSDHPAEDIFSITTLPNGTLISASKHIIKIWE
jgi:hypothetical protein